MTMLRFIDDEGAPTRIGAMMFLHKLAAGPAVTTLTAAVTMGLTGQRAGSLRIHVIAGRGLPNMDDYGAMDPYVEDDAPYKAPGSEGSENEATLGGWF